MLNRIKTTNYDPNILDDVNSLKYRGDIMCKEKVINELTDKLISEIESNGIISVTEMFDYNSLNESLINIKKEIKNINSNEIRNQIIENIKTYGYEIHFKIFKSGISDRYIFYAYFTDNLS